MVADFWNWATSLGFAQASAFWCIVVPPLVFVALVILDAVRAWVVSTVTDGDYGEWVLGFKVEGYSVIRPREEVRWHIAAFVILIAGMVLWGILMAFYWLPWLMIYSLTIGGGTWASLWGARAIYRLNKKLNRHIEDPEAHDGGDERKSKWRQVTADQAMGVPCFDDLGKSRTELMWDRGFEAAVKGEIHTFITSEDFESDVYMSAWADGYSEGLKRKLEKWKNLRGK